MIPSRERIEHEFVLIQKKMKNPALLEFKNINDLEIFNFLSGSLSAIAWILDLKESISPIQMSIEFEKENEREKKNDWKILVLRLRSILLSWNYFQRRRRKKRKPF